MENSFYAFSEADWEKVYIYTLKVKELLVNGAFEFNESIHNILTEELVGSIIWGRVVSRVHITLREF